MLDFFGDFLRSSEKTLLEEKKNSSFPLTEVPNEITLLFIYKLAEQANDQKELIKNLFNTTLIFSGSLKKDPSQTMKTISAHISSFVEEGLIHYWNLGKPVEAHKKLKSLFSREGTRIKKLTLNQISESLFLLKACPNLNSLKICGCFDEISLKILGDYKCATTLQKLKIASFLSLNESGCESLIKFTALKALELRYAGVEINLSKLKLLSLEKLSLNLSIIDERNLNGLSTLTTLKKLTLGKVPCERFVSFFSSLKLSHLNIRLTNFQPETVTVLKDSLTLRTLDLGETNISHSSLEGLCKHPTLQILRLSKNPFIKPIIIKAIEASNLLKVTFETCLQMNKDSLSSSSFNIEEKKKWHLEIIRKKD
ncbi:hypothetical protein [Criblamydia sequanensis]|uniref:Leucine-rich repeat-containing protein n=1 Tax=Candidatus Criblamydia sequanensis CRIB-18 TaxID=1437425 RepID=A0A090D0I5_9BACT|nr:hypothetical protein [Criblamydia sequanensis]CDR33345.1 hypothetical protein CSEC_0510 [Criblamydia sequanensis CRIB-18]